MTSYILVWDLGLTLIYLGDKTAADTSYKRRRYMVHGICTLKMKFIYTTYKISVPISQRTESVCFVEISLFIAAKGINDCLYKKLYRTHEC